jgi:hypothetical protein
LGTLNHKICLFVHIKGKAFLKAANILKKKFIKFDLVSYEETLKYGKNQENRVYNHAHLERIKKQCLTSLEVMPPITINVVTNHVTDGQHRLKAFHMLIESGLLPKDTLMKVMLVSIPEEEEKQAIIDANIYSKNWSVDDFIGSYARAGVDDYTRLDTWCKKHTLTCDKDKSKFRYGAAIITGKRCQTTLISGDFTCTDEELKKAETVHAEMLEIVQLFGLKGKGSWIEALAVSWDKARKQHDFKTWFKELKAKKQRFLKLPKTNSSEWDNIFAQAHYAIDAKKGV